MASMARQDPAQATAPGTLRQTAPAEGATAPRLLVIACGALAHEIVALRRINGWRTLDVQCLPASLHNTPQAITAAVRKKIRANRNRYASIFVAYGDCGTGGALDAMLAEEGAERIAGAHCYEFFAGAAAFAALADEEPGTFYVTDFLAAHFERLVIRGLGIDRHPELAAVYFGRYRRLVYLAQAPSAERIGQAQSAARRLGLGYAYRHTGYGALEPTLRAALRHEASRASGGLVR